MALVATARGDRAQGESHLRGAIQTFASVDARCQAARSGLALAEVLAERHAHDEIRVELRAAQDAFREMPPARLVERAERLAGTVGVSLDAP